MPLFNQQCGFYLLSGPRLIYCNKSDLSGVSTERPRMFSEDDSLFTLLISCTRAYSFPTGMCLLLQSFTLFIMAYDSAIQGLYENFWKFFLIEIFLLWYTALQNPATTASQHSIISPVLLCTVVQEIALVRKMDWFWGSAHMLTISQASQSSWPRSEKSFFLVSCPICGCSKPEGKSSLVIL